LTNRSGTDAADIITTGSGGGSLRYWGLDGDDLFSGINISSGNVDFRLEGNILFDGGAGTDRMVVQATSPAPRATSTTSRARLFQGCTHRWQVLEFSTSANTYSPNAQAARREIEEIEGPDGAVTP